MIKDLLSLDLHDSPINSIKIDFEEGTITIIILQYDELLKDLFKIEMFFLRVENLDLGKIPEVQNIEIFSADISEISNNRFKINLLIVYDQPNINLNFQFEFAEIEINYPSHNTPHLT